MNHNKFRGITMLCLALWPMIGWSQNDQQFIVITRVHANPKSDFTPDQWKAYEKEFFDKVTSKNDLILGANVLLHYYTSDNSEVLFIRTYRSWSDIEKASNKNEELIKAAWPDEAKRKAFFEKRSFFYTTEHSDEIRQTLPNTKPLAAETTPQIYYVRTSHFAFPVDGKESEFKELMNEFQQNVILKNTSLKGYYPSRHSWGSDGRDFVEAFVYGSLADLEKSEEAMSSLIKAHWPDETKRKEFFDKARKYFEAWHGDAIYRHVPELRKVPLAVTK